MSLLPQRWCVKYIVAKDEVGRAARRAYIRQWEAARTPEQKAAKAEALREWRKSNPEKLAAQRAAYAEKATAARKAWREKNRETEQQAALERRRNDLAYRITKRYGVPIAEARELAANKPEACEICGVVTKLHFDHDHATGKHRGWLCPRCNHGLGNMADDPARLRAAAEYLEARRT